MTPRRLQEELKKRDAFACPREEALLNLVRTHDQFSNRFGKLFRAHGLTSSQYNVLRILRGEGKPLPCLEIAERMVQMVPAMTGLIDRLELQGLVERRRCPEDRRIIYVAITERGAKVVAKLGAPLRAEHEVAVGHMTAAELRQLSHLLEKARANQ